MSDPFGSPSKSVSRQRSRPNLLLPLPALPSSRSLNSITRSPSPPPTALTMNGESLKHHLASLVDQKASQLQMIGQLGSEILRQQQELNERMKDLHEGEEEELDEGTKRALRDLELDVGRWEKDNDDTLREIGGKAAMTDLAPSADDTQSSTLTRRQRNAQHRALDMEFATEIGQNLLAEVRRLQTLLGERDKALERLSEEKDSWDAERGVLVATVRAAESSVDRYKEENWNLEVNLQEIRNTHIETTEQLQKIGNEQSRLTKSLVSSRELAEMYKTDAEKHAQMVEDLRQRHETEMAQARRATAGLQRERSDLLTELNGERQRAISGVRARASRGGSASPAVYVNGKENEEEDEDDVFGGGRLSPRKRPGFDANDQALSPSQLYESDFGTPDPTPSKDKGYNRSPLGEMYVNEIDELRSNLEQAQAEIDRLKREKAGMGAADEFGVQTPGDEDEGEGEFGAVSGRGRGSMRGRRGRGRAIAASLSRKFGFNRTPSNLSNAGDRSFDSMSSGTPDLLRTRAIGSMDSPLSSSPHSEHDLRQMDSLDSLHLAPKGALSDELALGMGHPNSFDLPTAVSDAPSFMSTHPTDSTISELTTPRLAQFPADAQTDPASPAAGERTPTKSHGALPPSKMYESMTRSSSIEDGLTTDTDDADFTDARESVGTLTPSQSHADLTDAYATGQEWHTAAESSAGESSDEEERDRTRTFSGPAGAFAAGAAGGSWMARRMASRETMAQPRTVEVERIVERIVEVPVDRIVEVPVDRIVERVVEVPVDRIVEKIVEVEKRVEVPFETIREVEKIVEVEKRVEVPVPFEVIKEVEVIREVEKRVEVPVEVIKEVERIVEVEKRVEVPVPFEVIKEVEVIREVEKRVEVPVEVIKEVERIVEVEKRIEVPVEVIVEKRVEVPVEVEKIVEKEVIVEKVVNVEIPVDRIVEVEKIVERIVEVEKIINVEIPVDRIIEVEKRVEIPVDRIVEIEKIVEHIVEVPKIEYQERIVEVEKPVDRIVYVDRDVERIVEVEKPVDRIVHVDREVEKVVDRHVEVPVERIVEVEKRIEVPVEVIREVERIVEVEKRVEVRVPFEVIKEVERIVEVEKRVEVPVEVIREVEKIVEVEKRVEVPVEVIREVERIVEVEKRVEVPVPFEVIKEVEKIVEVEKRVEVPVPFEVIKEVEKIVEVEKRVEVPVEVIVERRVEVPVEVIKEVEKIVEVEKRVEVPVEVIREVEKIVEVEKRVEVPVPFEVIREVEKRVEVPVEVIREVVVEKIVEVEKRVEVPVPFEVIREVEKIVEVEKRVEVPVPFEVIREVEVEKMVEVEKRVEVPVPFEVERIVERIVEVPVDRIVERVVTITAPAPAPEPSTLSRSIPNDTSSQTDIIPALGPSLISPPPDLGMFRISSGANYDFLKAPPSPASTSTTVKNRRVSTETFGGRAENEVSVSGLPVPRSAAAAYIDGLPSTLTSPDLTRPPTMNLPPPPSNPPPAGLAKHMSTSPSSVPPRPQSPPPADFTRNTTKKRLSKPPPTAAGSAMRASEMGPPLSVSRQTSNSSFRNGNTEPSTPKGDPTAWMKSRESVKKHATKVISSQPGSGYQSATSSFSEAMHGRDPSLSSVESVIPPGSRNKAGMGSTDPAVIHAITQTMIGEYLWKYTRRTLGRGQSGNRHQRYFWIHPYTKTLYWGEEDPGSSVASESKAKSVYISSIKTIDDNNPLPPGLYNKSIIVATPGREIQFTAPNKDRHDLWLSALQFLLQQQNGVSPNGDVAQTTVRQTSIRQPLGPVDEQGRLTSTPKTPAANTGPKSPMSMRSFRSDNRSLNSTTPKALRSASSMSHRPPSTLGKRSGTAAYDYWERYTARHAVPETYHGGHRFKGDYKAKGPDDFDVVDRQEGDDQDESFEGVDNVRACCDGKHLVGDHKHHHSHRVERSQTPASQTPSVRAWSMASRRKSTATGKPTAASLFGMRRDGDVDGDSINASVRTADKSRSRSAMGFREGTATPTPAAR